MFTGIIEELGTVIDLNVTGTSLCLKIEAERFFQENPDTAEIPTNGLKIGDSIAVNGVCLTATEVQPRMVGHALPYFKVTAVKETLQKTTLGSLTVGTEDKASTKVDYAKVNLERAATLETCLGGHIVQGHVDGIATLLDIRDMNGSWEFSFQLPPGAERYVVPKGSITINGVSLTVAKIDGSELTIAIIPHTYHHTNFEFLEIGDMVNVEFDIIAKMVERLVKPYMPNDA